MQTVSEESRAGFASLAWLPLATLSGAAAVLTVCVASGTQLYDSGELAAAALELGGSHPPGQPLHALLAHAFLWLPLGPIQLRFGLLSLACALVAAWIVGLLSVRVCALLELAPGRLLQVTRAATMLGTLTALPVLRQTLRIEVYTLALALFVASVWQLVLWTHDARSLHLRAAAMLAGLAALVHPPHALSAALAGLCLGMAEPRRLLASPRVLLGAALSGVLPLLVFVYLPLRAAAGAGMWGNPTSLQGFWEYVSGQAFISNIARHDRLRLLSDYGSYLLQLTAGVPAIGMLIALRYAVALKRSALYGLLAASLVTLIAACLQPLEARNPDNVAYLAPALVLALIAGAAGFARLAASATGWQVVSVPALALLALSPASARELGEQLQSDVPALDALAVWSIDTPPPRALVLVTHDFNAASWMMARSVEGARPDIALFVRGLATSSWHWQQLRAHPAFDGRARASRGADAHERFARGAVLTALPHVPVVLERELPGIRAQNMAGPYLLVDRPPPGAAAAPAAAVAPSGEAWLRLIAREARQGPRGDSGAAAAIVRDALCQRSLRSFQRGFYPAALASVRLALWELPQSERARVHSAAASEPSAIPYIVDDADSYMVGVEDAVRQAAALLWARSDHQAASDLLQHQLQRGDPLALLQLAHLQASVGQRDGALQTLIALEPLLTEPQPELARMRKALAP
jgi:Protein of unknown function (DUF2723)